MYLPDGFAAAIVIGVIALLLPAMWAAWWFIADLGGPTGRRRPVA